MNDVKFTPRERQLIPYVVGLHHNKFIADVFHISEHAVKFHLTNIFKKTGTKNKYQFRKLYKEHMDKTMV